MPYEVSKRFREFASLNLESCNCRQTIKNHIEYMVEKMYEAIVEYEHGSADVREMGITLEQYVAVCEDILLTCIGSYNGKEDHQIIPPSES